jgi:hypothetical protein
MLHGEKADGPRLFAQKQMPRASSVASYSRKVGPMRRASDLGA